MPEDKPSEDEQLLLHLVSTFTQSAWIAMGKLKNPATDKIERSLDGASLYIDLLDMIHRRMKGNLSDWEEHFLGSTISNLKLNYMEEVKKDEEEQKEPTDSEEKAEEKAEKETSGRSGQKKRSQPKAKQGQKKKQKKGSGAE